MSLMSGRCAKDFYCNRIWIAANATKAIGLIIEKLEKFEKLNAYCDRLLYVKGRKNKKRNFKNDI